MKNEFKLKIINFSQFSQQWLSPEGCLMFSLQLHVPLKSPLGERLPLVQHLVATAVVNSISKLPGCQVSET
jgi:biotin---protein ligase